MKEIRLCDDTEVKRISLLCNDNNLGIEIQGFYNPKIIKNGEWESLLKEHKEILKDFKKGKSLHAPFWDLNLGSKNEDIKKVTMDTFNFAYNIAKELGCSEIVVHNGFAPNTSYYSGWCKNATLFWEEFFKDKDDSITMMIENQCEEDSEILKMVIDSVNDKRLKVCLDIGHAHANSNMKVEDWIITLANRIGYVHIHDNHGKLEGRPSYLNDEHLGLEMGNINLESVFSLLEEYAPDSIWNIECKLDYIEDSVNVLKKMGYIK
jgi:sugar phosphate isomerase/epimerase